MGKLLRVDRLYQVHPRLRLFAQQMADSSNQTWLVVTGVRGQHEVDLKYAQGRTAPGPHAGEAGYPPLGETITNVSSMAKAPHAMRVYPNGTWGCAVDLQFFVQGTMSLAEGKEPAEVAVYLELGELAEKAGLVWGGRFTRVDQAHVETPDWRNFPPVVASSI